MDLPLIFGPCTTAELVVFAASDCPQKALWKPCFWGSWLATELFSKKYVDSRFQIGNIKAAEVKTLIRKRVSYPGQ
jgi:hypothetical protein